MFIANKLCKRVHIKLEEGVEEEARCGDEARDVRT